MFKRIRWRIAIPYIILVLLATGTLTIYFSRLVYQAHIEDLRVRLTTDALVVTEEVKPLLDNRAVDIETIDRRVRYWGTLLKSRVTVIDADGLVLGDSHNDPAMMDNHIKRPEVQQALAEDTGMRMRYSRTMGYKMMYVAMTIEQDAHVIGFARVALPLTEIEARVANIRYTVLLASIITSIIAGILAFYIAERVTRPLRDMTRSVDRMAQGDWRVRIHPPSKDEVGQLAEAFNRMGTELANQMSVLAEQRDTLNTVLSHMADGVIAIDSEGRVSLMNYAAMKILNLSSAPEKGERFTVVVRDHNIIEVWNRCLETNEEYSATVEMGSDLPFLRVVATPLRDREQGESLVVLQDLTQIRRLERVRRDFMSNISHELRTPLASLKALVDTLDNGALDDPPAARRFLKRMDAEVDVLTQMVQELLELSRIESGRVPLRLSPTEIEDLILPPVDLLMPQVDRAELTLIVVNPPLSPKVMADAERVQRVVTNLLHNAIKFTPSGGEVTIATEPIEENVIFSVSDTGVGIPEDDLPRIFERFFKSDRARSGGGTGLGLAIAKHIVQAHGGQIWVESIEGRGSTFYFSLPIVNKLLTQR